MKPLYQIEYKNPISTISVWRTLTDPIEGYDECLEYLHYLRNDATRGVYSYGYACEYRMIKLTPEVLEV